MIKEISLSEIKTSNNGPRIYDQSMEEKKRVVKLKMKKKLKKKIKNKLKKKIKNKRTDRFKKLLFQFDVLKARVNRFDDRHVELDGEYNEQDECGCMICSSYFDSYLGDKK